MIPNQETLLTDKYGTLPQKRIEGIDYGLILAFFVWPFAAFVYALINYRRRSSQIIMVLFTGLYAYTMMAESAGLDLYRVLESAKLYATLSFDQVWAIVGGLYGQSDDAGVDVYRDLVAFFVTRFTNDGHVLMMVYGLIYGWLYVLSLKALLSVNRIKNVYTIFILISFSMIFSMDQVAGVRFATAAYVMFIGVFRFLQTKQLKFLIVAALSGLVHFSFLAVFVVFLLYWWLKPGNKILYILVIITFLAGNFFGTSIVSFIDSIGGSLGARAGLYTGQETIADQTVWFVKYREEMMMTYMLLYIVIIKFMNIRIKEIQIHKQLFGFSLALLSLSNITGNIPHAGYRYQFVAIMFFIAYVYLLYRFNHEKQTIRLFSLLSMPFFMLQIIYALRSILFYTPFTLFFGVSPMVLFMKVEQTVWDVIKSIF
jgi:hypothetical protein